jgi:toxin FitB
VVRWWGGQEIALSGHTHSSRRTQFSPGSPATRGWAPADAARLLDGRFASPYILSKSQSRKLPDILARLGISGGAVYDAVVALAAKEQGASLATRDARARGTYDAVGVELIVVT